MPSDPKDPKKPEECGYIWDPGNLHDPDPLGARSEGNPLSRALPSELTKGLDFGQKCILARTIIESAVDDEMDEDEKDECALMIGYQS